MLRLFRSEWLKLRKTSIWLILLLSPMISTLVALFDGVLRGVEGADVWIVALSLMSLPHALLFLPLMTGVFAAFVCRYEHIGGGWKQLLTLPVRRTQVYLVKLGLVMLMVAASQLLIVGGLLFVGAMRDYPAAIPWEAVGMSLLGGWLACLPLAALQMAVSTAWASFAAPLAVNVIFTLPNMLIANSATYGPYYPWAQPVLAMVPHGEDSFGAFHVPADSLFLVIFGSFLLFFVCGLLYFQRKAI